MLQNNQRHATPALRVLPTLLSVVLALSLVGLSACGGGGDNGSSADDGSIGNESAAVSDSNASDQDSTANNTADDGTNEEAARLVECFIAEVEALKVTTDSGKTCRLVNAKEDEMLQPFDPASTSAISIVAEFDHEIDEEEQVAWRDYLQSEEVAKTFAELCNEAHEMALEAGGDTEKQQGVLGLTIKDAWPHVVNGEETEDRKSIEIYYAGSGTADPSPTRTGDVFWDE